MKGENTEEYMNKIRAIVGELAPKKKELKYGSGDNELVVTVFPVLSFMKRAAFIKDVVDMAFDNSVPGVDAYSPERVELARRYATLRYFTDIELPDDDDVDTLWVVLNYTPIYADVANYLGRDLQDIFADADKEIEAKVRALASKTDWKYIIGKLTDVLNALPDYFTDDKMGAIKDMLSKLPEGSMQQIINTAMNSLRDKQE